MKTMEAKLEKYHVDQLGEIPIEREDGIMRIMVCQMGACRNSIFSCFLPFLAKKIVPEFYI